MIRQLRRYVYLCALPLLLFVLTFPLARRATMQDPGTSCVQVPSGIVSWYPADANAAEEGNAVDIVSHNDGTLENGATFAPGKVGSAFQLDGVNDAIEVPDSESLALNTLTIDAWINRANANDARIVDKITAGGADGYALDIVDNHLRLIVGDASVTGETAVETGNDVLVAGTFDGTTLTVYLNGQVDGTTNVESATTPTNNLSLHIGSDSTGTGNNFGGQIDEVELFNRALTQQEILSIFDASNMGKCRASVGGGQLIISEFRFRGPGSARPTVRAASKGGGRSPAYLEDPNGYDEFVELYNNTDVDITVSTEDGSAGWALASESNNVSAESNVAVVIPNGTVIPARRHYLIANTEGYSLGGYPAGPETSATPRTTATPDQSYDEFDIPNNSGVALFNTADTNRFSEATRLDAVGFVEPPVTEGPAGKTVGRTARANGGGKIKPAASNPLYREGDGLPNPVNASIEHSFVRRMLTGRPQDTNNNAADFQLVAPDPTELAGAVLGAPGPENLSSPVVSTFKSTLIEPCTGKDSDPNSVRVVGDTGVAPSGSLTIRRRFINTSGQPLSQLRFRVVDITTAPAPDTETADLRVLSSNATDVQVMGAGCSGTSSVAVQGLTLEQPPSQPQGGGLNSTLAAGTITLDTPLMPDDSIAVQFLLGVQQPGNFRFFVVLEENFGGGNAELHSTRAKQKLVTGSFAESNGASSSKRSGGSKTKVAPRFRN